MVRSMRPLVSGLLILVVSVARAQISHTLPPTLTGLTFDPSAVGVISGPKQVTVTANITGDLTTYWIGPDFRSPSGKLVSADLIGWPQDIPPISGTNLNGVWTLTASFPQYSEAGTWKINSFYLRDHTNNSVTVNHAGLIAAGFPTELIVTTPSLASDGTINPSWGTVTDESFGSRAAITVPAGVPSPSASVGIAEGPGIAHRA